jgi:hypothetical protein
MLLISNPYLSLCFTIKGTGYDTKRPGRAQTLEKLGGGEVLRDFIQRAAAARDDQPARAGRRAVFSTPMIPHSIRLALKVLVCYIYLTLLGPQN